MTKEQYILFRNNGNFNIVYEYYKERFNHNKHRPFLGLAELPQFLIATGFNVNQVFDKCCKYYDEKFNIVHLIDKEGKLIKTL